MSEKRSMREILESMSTIDDYPCYEGEDHDDSCGLCFYRRCMADGCRQVLASGDVGQDALVRADEIRKRLWEESKFYKLWKEEQAAGRDPLAAFAERGWEP